MVIYMILETKYRNFVVGSIATEDEIQVLYAKSHIKSAFNVCFIDDCYRGVGTAEARLQTMPSSGFNSFF